MQPALMLYPHSYYYTSKIYPTSLCSKKRYTTLQPRVYREEIAHHSEAKHSSRGSRRPPTPYLPPETPLIWIQTQNPGQTPLSNTPYPSSSEEMHHTNSYNKTPSATLSPSPIILRQIFSLPGREQFSPPLLIRLLRFHLRPCARARFPQFRAITGEIFELRECQVADLTKLSSQCT